MLQCVLYIFLGGMLFLSNGCIPYQGTVTVDRVEYIDSYPPASFSYREAERFPVGYTMHRSKMPMRYHADNYDWYYYRGTWYKRSHNFGLYQRRMRGIYSHRYPRTRVYRPVLPKKTFIKPKRKKRKKKGSKWKK